jgi:predicted ATPase/DNA-binding SARP family transcriptional activator
MEFGILGPVEVRADGDVVALGGPKPRALLAVLLLHANETVSAERLAMGLWGEDAGADAVKSLHVHVSRLRKALGDADVLSTTAGGYRLHVGQGELDADRFERLVAQGHERMEDGDAARAAEVLREALALWRGPALVDVAAAPFAGAEIARLEEERLAAIETRVEADLAAGRHAEVVGELQQLAAADPVRERLHGLLMLALYRSGRQADALEAYSRVRAHLADELGLEPSPALKVLQGEILEQSASLDGAAITAHLPPRRSTLLGRAEAAGHVVELLQRDGAQLVTLIGVGGVGKTSLAIEVAHRLAERLSDGAAFVDLAAVTDPLRVPDAVLQALGGQEEPGTPASQTLVQRVARLEQLIVLDNFEHLLVATPLVPELLNAAPRLKLLVTSRAALDLQREQRYVVDPLELPESDDPVAVAAAPATALFIARAAAHDPGFRLTASSAAAIATVCERVDALPLAIELAAARTSVLSPEEIAGRLEGILSSLGSGPRDAPARQQTLRATLDWSHALLDKEEAAAFARLAVFAGGCSPDAAEQVAGVSLDVIEGLLAKSMLTRRPGHDGETRLVMLEPIRQYAAERLAAVPDAEAVEHRHERYFIEFAETVGPELMRADQIVFLRRIDAEAANLRRALARAQAAGDPEPVLLIVGRLDEWWFDRGLWSEARGWLEWALEPVDEHIAPEVRAMAWHALGYLLWPEEDYDRILAVEARAWELMRTTDDEEGKAHVQVLSGFTHLDRRDVESARRAALEAVRLAEGIDDRTRDGTLGVALHVLFGTEPDTAEARRIAERAADHLERAGDLRGLARLCEFRAYRALFRGDLDEARELIGRSLAGVSDRRAESVTAYAFSGVVALESGDDEAARRQFRTALVSYGSRGITPGLSWVLLALASVAARDGEATRAGRLLGAATAVRSRRTMPDELEEHLEAGVRAIARERCDPATWESAIDAGLRLTPRERIELGLEAARAGL